MLFLIEQAFKGRKAKIAEWEREADAWVAERNERFGYGYDREAYERSHPYPVARAKDFWYWPLVLFGIAAATYIFYLIFTMPPPKTDPNNPHNCSQVVKKGDKVVVNYGPFLASKGEVVDQNDDCGVNIKLSESTRTVADCAKRYNDCRDARDVGMTLYVDSSENITKL